MNLIRSLLFENLGLKLAAILLALLVYVHVYTERPATMIIAFPIELMDLEDSLSFSGPVPKAVEAELRGTGKQLIRLRLTEPRLKISLAGIDGGRFIRRLSVEDLPIMASDRLRVERLLGPGTIELNLERMTSRPIPVAARLEGKPQGGLSWSGQVMTLPPTVLVRGPLSAVAALDSVRLLPVRLDSKADTVRAQAMLDSLPPWCTAEPPSVTVLAPLRRSPS